MLAGTHIVCGIAIYEATERLGWLRLPLVLGGGYVSHYLLDSAASYHQSWPDSLVDVGLLWVQMACVAIVIGAIVARRRAR
jgi:hypothetical protein